jgi:hypothetical protein
LPDAAAAEAPSLGAQDFAFCSSDVEQGFFCCVTAFLLAAALLAPALSGCCCCSACTRFSTTLLCLGVTADVLAVDEGFCGAGFVSD